MAATRLGAAAAAAAAGAGAGAGAAAGAAEVDPGPTMSDMTGFYMCRGPAMEHLYGINLWVRLFERFFDY